jgi:hypothetical protein
MKRERPHRVPLVDRALVILAEMKEVRRGEYVFPSFRADKGLSDGAFDALLDRMKVKATTHGFRSSFRDWAGDCTAHARERLKPRSHISWGTKPNGLTGAAMHSRSGVGSWRTGGVSGQRVLKEEEAPCCYWAAVIELIKDGYRRIPRISLMPFSTEARSPSLRGRI